MSIEEFKNNYPEYSALEGNDLWDKMTEVMLRHQSAYVIIEQTEPFYKRYQLRWLFYRQLPNMIFTKEWQAETVCKICGRGANSAMVFSDNFLTGERQPHRTLCLGCGNDLVKVPNGHLKYRLWLAYKPVERLFWLILDKIHLVRSSHSGRYDMFGDEMHYVKHHIINMEAGTSKAVLRSRKWYEYIFIKTR